MTNEFKSNSHRAKENKDKSEPKPEKKIEKIVSGKVKTKKKNEFTKFTENFISEDLNNVKSYILVDVLIPTIKNAVSDIVKNGIEMLLFGETTGRKKNNASRVSYRNYYDDDRSSRTSRQSTVSRSTYNYDEIIFDNRGEAEDVLARMDELIDTYEVVSIADLYDLVGMVGNHTDNKYGWTNISSAKILRVRDGYLIKMPRAIPLD